MTGGAAGRRAAKRPKETACIVIHDLGQAIAALSAAAAARKRVTLWSAEGAGIYAGAGWFAAVERRSLAAVPSAKANFVLDCAERADMVQEAFRAGIKGARFSGSAAVAARLDDIASKSRANLYRRRPKALDLRGADDPQNACLAYLSSD
jgi:polysaccharide deacetylase 2 family uncharacterized protein YibQ